MERYTHVSRRSKASIPLHPHKRLARVNTCSTFRVGKRGEGIIQCEPLCSLFRQKSEDVTIRHACKSTSPPITC
jgi:hypothetical protein